MSNYTPDIQAMANARYMAWMEKKKIEVKESGLSAKDTLRFMEAFGKSLWNIR